MAHAFYRKVSSNIGTDLTTIGSYVVDVGKQTAVMGLSVCNKANSTVYVDAVINDGSNNIYLIKSTAIYSNTTMFVIGGDQKIVLQSGDSIKIKSSIAASVDAVLSITEMG